MTLISDQFSFALENGAGEKPASANAAGPYVRPFLKWAGGKFKLLERILDQLPLADRLIEPFAGSAVVALNAPHAAVLAADRNPDLINLYKFVQNDTDAIVAIGQQLFVPENNSVEAFMALRAEFNESDVSLRRSAIFIYLNRHCFNGLCRYNSRGKFNVPFGRYKSPGFPETEIRRFAARTQRVEFRLSDFEALMAEAGAGDVVYCDPPYAPLSSTSNFTSYSKDEFGLADQQRLADTARMATSRGATVLISNHDTPDMRTIYKGADISAFKVQRAISADSANRWAAGEILALFRP